MHLRFLPWLFVGALLTLVCVRAQAPAAGNGKFDTPGTVLVAKVVGKVTMVLNGETKELKVNDAVPQTAKITTANNASVVLAFSNGASTQLGADTELVIEEFLQDPFGATLEVANATEEPTPSRTKLSLNRGELVGNVKKLKYERGSSFTVQTPVGAAGIRGTTFRIVFRPSGTGQAFFTLSTASGIVAFEPPSAPGGTPTNTNATPQTNAQPNAPQETTPNQNTQTQSGGGTTTPPAVTGSGTAAVPVPQGQEISLVVNVTQNAQGQFVVSVLPPPPSSTTGISPANMQAVTQVASDIAIAVQQTVFTSPPPSAPGQSSTGTGGTSGSGNSPTTGTTTGSTTGSTTGQTQSQTTNISGQNFTGQVNTPVQPKQTQPTRPGTLSNDTTTP